MYNKNQYNITRHEKKIHNLEHVLHNRLVLCLASRRVWLSRSFLCISYVSFLPLEQRHPTFPFQNPLCTHKYGTDFCSSFLDHLPFLVFPSSSSLRIAHSTATRHTPFLVHSPAATHSACSSPENSFLFLFHTDRKRPQDKRCAPLASKPSCVNVTLFTPRTRSFITAVVCLVFLYRLIPVRVCQCASFFFRRVMCARLYTDT